MTATASTAALYQAVRSRILIFVPFNGTALSTVLGERLWIVQAPDDAAFPYGTMRFINTNALGEYNGDKLVMDLEVMLYDTPRSHQAALEGYADIADQSLLRWSDASSGLIFTRERSRYSLPVFPPPADREVCGVRLVYPLSVWPTFITQYANQEVS